MIIVQFSLLPVPLAMYVEGSGVVSDAGIVETMSKKLRKTSGAVVCIQFDRSHPDVSKNY
jgi:hypothetical protein